MMCEGTLLDMIPNFATGSVELKLKISGCEILEHTKEWKDKKLRVNITKQRAKRSLDANGYYWALLSQVAGCMGISKEEAHNKMICEYGQPETQEDGTVVRFAMLSGYRHKPQRRYIRKAYRKYLYKWKTVHRVYHDARIKHL